MADEPGSGMRNTYKYTKPYSGGMPEFDKNEEEIFLEYAMETNVDCWIIPELVTDVGINALNQKRDAAGEELLKVRNHYLDADAFIRL